MSRDVWAAQGRLGKYDIQGKLDVIDEEKRLQVIFSAVELAHGMREIGFPRTAYSKILRETIHFVWEIREMPKRSKFRLRSKAAARLPVSELDYDHAIPMRVVIEMLLSSWPDKKAVEQILMSQVRGVLITKKEHERLREEKLASRMPDDWDGKDWTARYKKLGIEVLPEKSGAVT